MESIYFRYLAFVGTNGQMQSIIPPSFSFDIVSSCSDSFNLQYYFEGRFDLLRFVKEVHKAGLYVHLRIGPYACAEWNYGLVLLLVYHKRTRELSLS